MLPERSSTQANTFWCLTPAYPVYANGSTILCDGKVVPCLLLKRTVSNPILKPSTPMEPRMMFINYPNNPTAATTDKKSLEKAVDFAKDNNIILCYDNAYSEITYDGYRAAKHLRS